MGRWDVGEDVAVDSVLGKYLGVELRRDSMRFRRSRSDERECTRRSREE